MNIKASFQKVLKFILNNKNRIKSNIENKMDQIAINLINDLDLYDVLQIAENKLEARGLIEEANNMKILKNKYK